MLAELEADVETGTLYQAPQLSEEGRRQYEHLLQDAIVNGTEVSFAEALQACGGIRPPNRWQHAREIDAPAALAALTCRLAERELHRFYIRGLCRRALEQGVDTLEIYRARPPDPGRTPSNAMIGVRIAVTSLLEDLRGTFCSFPPHGLPQCRDPGLSVRLPENHRAQHQHGETM
jgi:hypothetical protein